MNEKLPKSVQFVKDVGPKRANLLSKLNIETVEDLLYHFPRDYEDRSDITKIKYVRPGQEVTVRGKVIKVAENKIKPGLSLVKVTLSDDSDVLNAVWFNQSYLKKKFKEGKHYIFSGQIDKKSWYKYNKKQLNNPVFEEIGTGDNIHVGRIVPVYSLTKGIKQKRMRKIIYNTLNDYACHIKEVLPESLCHKHKFAGILESLWGIHFPDNRKHYLKARKRLAFEELFFLQLLVLDRKKGIMIQKGINHKDSGQIINKFLQLLSFELTSAQQKVWKKIKADMETTAPMQQLLQGDVGSGKTVVATLALVETMANGYQGVFMAPTEILAEQHFLRLEELLSPMGFNVALLVGNLKEKQRQEIKEGIINNKIDLVIGTHALFQKEIEYNEIGLVVIDEQHRFGVDQRHSLKSKGNNPDLLVMTATPIPRSLALTLYGDLDLSVIDELPPGRKPVITTWRTEKSRNKIYNFVKDKLKEGRQAYVVCPLIEETDDLPAISVEELKCELENNYLQEFTISLLHSKLSSIEKKDIMKRFRKNEIDVLVSTTVIEVGVDVANASIMVIENAERFGLAQLHQLRGRVGRGTYKSYCILIANPTTEDSKKRLKVMTSTDDGFQLAEEDLKIRGPGEFFGTRQHGIPDFKIASIIKDQRLLNLARDEARKIIRKKNWENKYFRLKEKLEELDLKV